MENLVWLLGDQAAAAAIIASAVGLIGSAIAIAAAWKVGSRQTQILDKQVEISLRALELEELKLKSDLYDRRMEVFDAARRFLDFVLRHDRVPGLDRDADNMPIELELYQAFSRASSASYFLFSQPTTIRLNDIWMEASNCRRHRMTLDSMKNDPVTTERYLKSFPDRLLPVVTHMQNLTDYFPELSLVEPSFR